MKYLLLGLVLVTAVMTTAEGQTCRADLDDNRVVNFGDFLLFVNQFNLTPSTGCTSMPIDCRSAVQVAVANQIEKSKKELQGWVDGYTSCHDGLLGCNGALDESSRVIARKDSVIAHRDSVIYRTEGRVRTSEQKWEQERRARLRLRQDSIRLARERWTYLHNWHIWRGVSGLAPIDSEIKREDLCYRLWKEPWPATRDVLGVLVTVGVISIAESVRIESISSYGERSRTLIKDSPNWSSRLNDERTRAAKKAAGCSDWPRN